MQPGPSPLQCPQEERKRVPHRDKTTPDLHLEDVFRQLWSAAQLQTCNNGRVGWGRTSPPMHIPHHRQQRLAMWLSRRLAAGPDQGPGPSRGQKSIPLPPPSVRHNSGDLPGAGPTRTPHQNPMLVQAGRRTLHAPSCPSKAPFLPPSPLIALLSLPPIPPLSSFLLLPPPLRPHKATCTPGLGSPTPPPNLHLSSQHS